MKRTWIVLAAAFVAAGLYSAVTGQRDVFIASWSVVLLSALVLLREDRDKGAVLGFGLLSAFIHATGTQDKVYTLLAAGVVYLLSVVWIRSEDKDTSWYLGGPEDLVATTDCSASPVGLGRRVGARGACGGG